MSSPPPFAVPLYGATAPALSYGTRAAQTSDDTRAPQTAYGPRAPQTVYDTRAAPSRRYPPEPRDTTREQLLWEGQGEEGSWRGGGGGEGDGRGGGGGRERGIRSIRSIIRAPLSSPSPPPPPPPPPPREDKYMYVNRGAGGEVRRVRQSKGKGRRGGQDDVAALLAAVGLSGSDIYIYVHTHTCIRVYVYTYVYIHTHAHTRTCRII